MKFIPYGQIDGGQYGLLYDTTSQTPLASTIEIVSSLPVISDPDNYDGRVVFVSSTVKLYVFTSTPNPQWVPVQGVPVDIGAVLGNPPLVPTPTTGSLYWDTDTAVLFVYTGTVWERVSGLYGAAVREQFYVGDGNTTSFATGQSSPLAAADVEAFWDGVRQRSGVDYIVSGTNVIFTTAPPNGVYVHIRSMSAESAVRNAQIAVADYTASAGQTVFTGPLAGMDPASVFVFRNGLLLTNSVDYTLTQVDTTITAMSKTSATVMRATTSVAHGIPVGGVVRLTGILETAYNNRVVTVSAVPSPTTFEFNVDTGDPNTANPNPVMSYYPGFINDVVTLSTPAAAGDQISIRSLSNVATGVSNTGESNTISSVGTGTSLVYGKVGVDLQVKSIEAGNRISIVDTGTSVRVDSQAGNFVNRTAISSNNYTALASDEYIGVTSTASPVAISLSGIPQDPSNNGKILTIKDESGGAGTNSITINGGSANIDGNASVTISTNYGSVTMVMDGVNWHVISRVI